MSETKKLARIARVVSDQCLAHNRRGGQCRRKALLGSKVCALHGGKAPQVMAAARRRLELAAITSAHFWKSRALPTPTLPPSSTTTNRQKALGTR
jgi:hypothetical protein